MLYANLKVIGHEKILAYAGLEHSPVEAKYYEASANPSVLAGPGICAPCEIVKKIGASHGVCTTSW